MRKTAIIILILSVSLVQAQDTRLLKLKAAFLYHFTKYLEWPDDKKQGDFIIAVLNDEQLYRELEIVADYKKNVGNQRLIIKNYTSISAIEPCNLLYVPKSSHGNFDLIAQKTQKFKILLVADGSSYLAKGAGICFVTNDERLGFEMNKKEIESLGMKVANELVKMASSK